LGYQSALDEEMLFNSEDWGHIPTIIIADIVNSEKSISQIVEFTVTKCLMLKGYVSLIRLQDESTDAVPRSLYWDPPPNLLGELPKFFVAEYSRPLKAKVEELSGITEENFFIVEPHSLEVFSQKSLSGAYDINSPKGKRNQNRLTQLEEANALRFGHWISGSHHFMITTSINKILTDDILGPNICNEILNKIKESDIDIVLMPLHSHISDIIPRLTTAVKLASSKSVIFSLCLSTKAMTTNSFYMLPKPIKDIIAKHAEHAKDSTHQKLNIMILDDAIATGRTLDTIIRSIMLQIRKVVKKNNLTSSPIALIHSYTIIDRQGRAKSTLLTGISTLSCQGDGEWHSDHPIELNFKHDRWLDVDMPVYDRESCKICFERNQLQALVNSSFVSMDHSAVHEIKNRIFELRPQSSEVPAFLDMNKRLLPLPVIIGHNSEAAGSVELALWEINNLINRGASFKTLLAEYNNLYSTYPAEFAENKTEENQQILIIENLRLLTKEWNKLNSQAEGQNWIDILQYHIDRGGVISKVALWEAGNALATSNNEYVDLLLTLFEFGLNRLAALDIQSDPNGKKRENIYIGLVLYILSNNYLESLSSKRSIGENNPITIKMLKFVSSINKESLDILTRIYLDEIVSFLHRADNRDNFMPALMSVLNQTVRPGRHNHDHLLPSLLSSILKNKAGQNEVRLVRDILADLLHCIDVIDRRFFSLFDNESRATLPFYRKNIEQIISEIGKGTDCATDKVKSLVSKLYRHYPHQHHNPLYQALRRTQVSIKHILSLITTKCSVRNPIIEVLLDSSCTGIDNVNVIAPNIKIIEELVSNFTVNASIVMSSGVNPKLLVKVVHSIEKETIGKLQLHFYSNYNNDKNCILNILNGPGIKEASTRTLELFRIKIFPIDDAIGEYNMHIVLELCIGYPL
jgi:hypothetical protein